MYNEYVKIGGLTIYYMSDYKESDEKKFSQSQINHLKAIEVTVRQLLEILEPKTIDEINSRLHGEDGFEEHTYPQIARWYLTEELDTTELSSNPLIKSLIKSPYIKGEDLENLEYALNKIDNGDYAEDYKLFIYSIIEDQLPFFAGHISTLVNLYEEFQSLSSEQRTQRRGKAFKAWWEKDPEEALRKSKENWAKGREINARWTEETTGALIRWFREGKKISEIIELLGTTYNFTIEERDLTATISYLRNEKGIDLPYRYFQWDAKFETNKNSEMSANQILALHFKEISEIKSEKGRLAKFQEILADYGLDNLEIGADQFNNKFRRLKKRES